MDEARKQVRDEKRETLPMEPGKPKREDDEYERKGTGNICAACEPLTGKNFFSVTSSRTKTDWAYFLRDLIDGPYKDAEKIILVLDNLNTHGPGSFYTVFPAAEAQRLAQKLEIHATPTHGSWLNMAEMTLSIRARQCVSTRRTSKEEAKKQIMTWQQERNQAHMTMNWRFTAEDARIKLKRLYPVIEQEN